MLKKKDKKKDVWHFFVSVTFRDVLTVAICLITHGPPTKTGGEIFWEKCEKFHNKHPRNPWGNVAQNHQDSVGDFCEISLKKSPTVFVGDRVGD